jgi:hypothetical protein
MTPDFKFRLVVTRVQAKGWGHAVAVRRIDDKVMVVYAGSGAEAGMFVKNPLQHEAKGKDGFFVVLTGDPQAAPLNKPKPPTPRFDTEAYTRLIEYSRTHDHVAVADPPALRQKVFADIEQAGRRERVLVVHSADFSLVVEKDAQSRTWVPRAFLRMRLPEKKDFSDPVKFLNACVDYHTSAWVLEHPTQPYYFRPSCGVTEVRAGVWAAETGPAVVAGHGLRVEVDAAGKLVSIKEVFNPE